MAFHPKSPPGGSHMKTRIRPSVPSYFLFIILLPLLSAIFLYLETVTHYEFLLHVAAIPLEILAGALLVDRYLAWRERQRRGRQLVFIKSCLFRSELRSLYLTNFAALAEPRISLADIEAASQKQLTTWLQQLKDAKYRSPEAMESVITEYVNAEPVFNRFLQWSIDNDSERIFHDMIMLTHFIHDVRLFRQLHPDTMFMTKAAEDAEMMQRTKTILTDGLAAFLRFCGELEAAEPQVFATLMQDYRHSAAIFAPTLEAATPA
jgi:hypothetical protein